MTIRPTQSRDIADMQTILDETQLFPSTFLPDMIAGFLDTKDGSQLWLSCESEGSITGFCFAEPEPHTDGTWNMRALAVLPTTQRNGHGAALVAALEAQLAADGHRILIVDTSGAEAYAQARAFYAAQHYEDAARIRDFWAAGDDKVTFRKTLI
ncbi:MAG: GNAT family N-acetyltransferase [Roseobacter sp.]|jgi:ribosomal protein S18 acetylase RimI-like enzyme|nr:GNAT family N-acetyltransferase [Roseobacter sp.]